MATNGNPGTVYIPALMYQCGSYQRQSSFCGDLVLAVNLSERKLAWDVFAVNSLLRMEISLDDIASMSIEPQSESNGIMLLNLHRPPQFFCGWSEPHTPTVWVRVNDFTGHQAVRFRHHVFCFLTSALSEPIQRLLAQEPQLKRMADLGLSPDEPLHFADYITQAAMNIVGPQPVPSPSPMSPLSPMSSDSSPYNTPTQPEARSSHYQAAPAPAPGPRPSGNRIPLSQLNRAQRKQLLRPHASVSPTPPPPSGYQQHYSPFPAASPMSPMDEDEHDSAMDVTMIDPIRSHSMPVRTDFLGNAYPQAPPAFQPNPATTTAFGFSSGFGGQQPELMGTFTSVGYGGETHPPHQSPAMWPAHSDFMDGIDEGPAYAM